VAAVQIDQVVLTVDELDQRIIFHEDKQIMEVSFGGVVFSNAADVSAFYDRIEERVAETGEELWFFLVNYSDARIEKDAWFAFARRGKELNLAHSMGTVRFDASEATRRQIERDANTEAFDPNLFTDRDAAIAKLCSLPSKRRKRVRQTSRFTARKLNHKINFLPHEGVMEVDFSNMTFENSADVNAVYDFIEEEIGGTGRRWYFLVNYEGTAIEPAAWVQYARRGKALNERWSLGSVRYAPGSDIEADIRLRAESQDFRPNIRNTREEALVRIGEMKEENR
jgi:hypothetical protein